MKYHFIILSFFLFITPFGSNYQLKHLESNNNLKSQDKDCMYNGIPLHGKVKFVESNGDFKIKFVESFPDINVKFVESFPDDCGEWKIVESFPDFEVEIVESFPDLEVKVVNSFPGMED